jgi:hypothetical protein
MLRNTTLTIHGIDHPNNLYKVGETRLKRNPDDSIESIDLYLDCYPTGIVNGKRNQSTFLTLHNKDGAIPPNPSYNNYEGYIQAQWPDKVVDGTPLKDFVTI